MVYSLSTPRFAAVNSHGSLRVFCILSVFYTYSYINGKKLIGQSSVQSDTKLFTIFLFYNICYFKSNSLSRWILLLYSCYNIHRRCLELFLMGNHWSSWDRKWWRHHYFITISYLQLELWNTVEFGCFPENSLIIQS